MRLRRSESASFADGGPAEGAFLAVGKGEDMKTSFRQNRDVFVVDIEGNLDIHGVDRLNSLFNQNAKRKKIVFNLKSLSFVGSLGIADFSKTITNLKDNDNECKICCASSEFEKIFSNEGLDWAMYPSEEEALSSFPEGKSPHTIGKNLPPSAGNKKQT